MRWHRLESAGALDVRRADGIIMRAEIHGSLTCAARPTDYDTTFATDAPRETFVTAWLLAIAVWLVAIEAGGLFATRAIAYDMGARVARPRSTKWADAACAQQHGRQRDGYRR